MGGSKDLKFLRSRRVLLEIYPRFLQDYSVFDPFDKEDVTSRWNPNQQSAFETLRQKLCEASILALPEGSDDFVVYYDASILGL